MLQEIAKKKRILFRQQLDSQVVTFKDYYFDIFVIPKTNMFSQNVCNFQNVGIILIN